MKSPLTQNLIPSEDNLQETLQREDSAAGRQIENSLFPPVETLQRPRKRSALKSGDLSFMKSRLLHEAVNDPTFIDDLMSNNSRQSKQARFDERPPVVHIRPSEAEDEYT